MSYRGVQKPPPPSWSTRDEYCPCQQRYRRGHHSRVPGRAGVPQQTALCRQCGTRRTQRHPSCNRCRCRSRPDKTDDFPGRHIPGRRHPADLPPPKDQHRALHSQRRGGREPGQRTASTDSRLVDAPDLQGRSVNKPAVCRGSALPRFPPAPALAMEGTMLVLGRGKIRWMPTPRYVASWEVISFIWARAASTAVAAWVSLGAPSATLTTKCSLLRDTCSARDSAMVASTISLLARAVLISGTPGGWGGFLDAAVRHRRPLSSGYGGCALLGVYGEIGRAHV